MKVMHVKHLFYEAEPNVMIGQLYVGR